MRNHGLFVAFAPAESPSIAVAIIVENGGGSSAASPIARAVIDTWLGLDYPIAATDSGAAD